jgi:uncharacterized membrane protein
LEATGALLPRSARRIIPGGPQGAPMSQIETYQDEPGRLAALVVYALYLLSIPSALLLVPVGLFVAYSSRSGAGPVARSHLETQISLFWVAFFWGVGLFFAGLVGWALTIVLIGFPILWLVGIGGFIVMAWFTVMSVLGLIKLVSAQPA